ncbi:IPT/TIG domain-containing protein [Streptomyces sp. NPDC088337]|uniref:IPT/TIG domain-containing protein n=1 Tax=unclassified Streptomyces TaxID=2593676 RepID=UPI002DDB2AAD|nr:IPT/TIG domain-containing protein [Streptomyces sp. NBC_01788]WSB24811.1 IPT/TIG domain-containing protein [Streptomyces sp. NBC_01788]
MAAPTVSSISPSQGPSSGGNTVTVTGTDFTGVIAVQFGGRAAISFTALSGTQLTAVPPSGAGTVNVTVTTSQGTSTQTVTYTYVSAPTVSGVTPSQGPVSGGTTVALTGTNLSGATAVLFDGIAATSFTVLSATRIVAVTPAHAAGAAAVTVTTPGGTSNPDTPSAYFYYAPVPSLTDIEPPAGPSAGGAAATLTGSGLLNATAVRFDTAAASFTVVSATQITVVTPAHAAGAAAVTVTTPGGTSNPLSYVYLDPPILISVIPGQGPTYAGAVVTLTGSNLTTTTGVEFGGVPASFTVLSPTSVTAVAPAGAAGVVTVTVTTPAGVSNGLTYTRTAGPAI